MTIEVLHTGLHATVLWPRIEVFSDSAIINVFSKASWVVSAKVVIIYRVSVWFLCSRPHSGVSFVYLPWTFGRWQVSRRRQTKSTAYSAGLRRPQYRSGHSPPTPPTAQAINTPLSTTSICLTQNWFAQVVSICKVENGSMHVLLKPKSTCMCSRGLQCQPGHRVRA